MRKEIWWLLVSLIAAAAMGLAITRGEVDVPKPTPTGSKVAEVRVVEEADVYLELMTPRWRREPTLAGQVLIEVLKDRGE